MKVGDCVRITEEGAFRAFGGWAVPPSSQPLRPPAGAVGYVLRVQADSVFVRFIGGHHNGFRHPAPPGWWLEKSSLELVS